MGQAPGIATAIASHKNKSVQGINIKYLQEKLKAAGVIIITDYQKWETNDSK